MPAPTPPPAGGAEEPAENADSEAPAPSEPSFFDKLSTQGKLLLCSGLFVAGTGILAAGSMSATGPRYSSPSGIHSYNKDTNTHNYTIRNAAGEANITMTAQANNIFVKSIGRVQAENNTQFDDAELEQIILLSDEDNNSDIDTREANEVAYIHARRVLQRR